jgi:hypothetical protein
VVVVGGYISVAIIFRISIVLIRIQ